MNTTLPMVVAFASAFAATSASAAPGRVWCSDSLVRGTYGIQASGSRPASPGGPLENVIGIVLRQYDGRGGLYQWSNFKGAQSGYAPDLYTKGTYRVEDDCTMTVEFQPAPGVLVRERLVIVDDGNELRAIAELPPSTMITSVQKRVAPVANAQAGRATVARCSSRMIKGTYGIQMQGTRALAPGAEAEPVIGIVVRYYDSDGTVFQWDSIKGATSGIVPNRYGTGTYRVNDDCTVDVEFHPAPGFTIVERGVIVDDGNEIRTISAAPAGVMVTATHRRI